MSYRIEYSPKKPGKAARFFLCLLFFLLGLLIQRLSLPQSAPALEAMAAGLKAGAPMGKTLETFCQEIFYGIS